MKPKLIQLLICIILLFTSFMAQAAITCSAPISTGFSTAYATTGVVPNTTQGQVSFTCTRSAVGDPTVVYLRADNGVNVCAGSNDASFSGSCIRYEAYINSTCTGTIWTSAANGSFITVNLANVLTPQPFNINYWGCIVTAGQNPAAGAGTYTDTVITRLKSSSGNTGGTIYNSSTFPVSISFPATCSITSIGNVAFGTYVAFRVTPLVAPTANIVLNCTNRLPYTMSLNANNGVVAGLNYSLSINSLTPPVASRGTGPGQAHSLVGTMSANQAGTCATGTCAGTNTHTLTITY
jgi:spore coat protein U-like protein